MSEWEEKLNSLLSNPDAMAQVMELAQNLSAPQESTPPKPPQAEQNASPSVSQMLSSIDPALLKRLIPALQEWNRPAGNDTAAFLFALRPFLRPSRREKVERAVQLAKILHVAKTFFGNKEESNV